MITRLHHAAVLTRNIDDAISYYAALLGCETPGIAQVDRPGVRLRTALLPIGPTRESLLQLFEPSEGPGLDELERGSEGTIFEVAFEVDNIEEFYDRMISRGVTPIDISGQPFSGKYIISSRGNKYFYLPKSHTRGTRIEIVQIMGKAVNKNS